MVSCDIDLAKGLDNSGKTTLTRTIAGDVDPFIVPTVGFSAPVKKTLFGYDVVFYDLGGGARIRGVWPQYFADVHGIVFVVDCADPSRLPEASKELHSAMNHPMIVGKPLLIFANKADVVGAVTEADLANSMSLDTLALSRSTVVRGVAKMGVNGSPDPTVTLGLEWLMKAIGGDLEHLNERRVKEMGEHKAAEDKRRAVQKANFAASQAAAAAASTAAAASSLDATSGTTPSSSSSSTTSSPDAPPGEAGAKPVKQLPSCSRCPGVPAARRCAASKWEAVCEPCAVALERLAAETAAAVAAAEEEEERRAEGRGAAGVGLSGSSSGPVVVSDPHSAAAAGVAGAAASVVTTTNQLEPATPSKVRVMETVSAPPTPALGGEGGGEEETTSAVLTVRSPPGLGAGVEGGVEGGVPSASPPQSMAEPALDSSSSSSSAGGEGGGLGVGSASATALAIEEAGKKQGSGEDAAPPPAAPTPAPPKPASSSDPSFIPCRKCGVEGAVRRCALEDGVWAPVCGPCGDELESKKPKIVGGWIEVPKKDSTEENAGEVPDN